MERKILIRASITAAAAVCAAVTGVCALNGIQPPPDEIPDYYIQNTPSPEKTEYIVKDYEGYVCIYSADRQAVPEKITHIETSGLRKTDQKLLMSGIPVSNREELLTLLEDFDS